MKTFNQFSEDDSEKLRGGFTSPWEYEQHAEHEGKTYHVWSANHKDGYKAYQITRQPATASGVDYIKPKGTGHFTSRDAITRRTGIKLD